MKIVFVKRLNTWFLDDNRPTGADKGEGMTIKPEELYAMKCGETLYPDNNSYIVRMPGGWIWVGPGGPNGAACAFVPFDNEFQPR